MNPLADLHFEPAGVPRGRAVVQRAHWASRAFATYDVATVRRIARAASEAGAAHARELGEQAVAETGFGVAEHKARKNVGCSRGIWEAYGSHDYVSPVADAAGIVRVPRPAGVILALTPSTNPVATVFFKIMLALLTRNAIVVSPHPFAKEVSARAATIMADAAVAAGAPDGCVQVLAEPSVPLVNALMSDEWVAVIVATGGSAMVRAAYSSGNPALGVGPGNVPVVVDGSADPVEAARLIVESKSFDHSVLCTNESVAIVTDDAAERFTAALRRAGAHVADAEETAAIREAIFDGDHLRTSWIGRSAVDIAAEAGVRVAAGTNVLVTPIDLVVPEEMLAHEKLLPVLALVRVPTTRRAIDTARAVLRISGQGHSAAIHSADPATVVDFAAAVPVHRVSVNVGNSLGSSGFETGLAPTMTIGTGFSGRSSLGGNLAPEHLVHHTSIAYGLDHATPVEDLVAHDPWHAPAGPVPEYPRASNLATEGSGGTPVLAGPDEAPGSTEELREQIRRLVVEELHAMVRS